MSEETSFAPVPADYPGRLLWFLNALFALFVLV